jgi:hypothetical protein
MLVRGTTPRNPFVPFVADPLAEVSERAETANNG